MRQTYYIPLLLLAGLIGSTRCPADPQPISVTVNNRPVTFAGTEPVQQKGAVLVPLRGVFEALGATVDYDAAAKSITAKKGETTVVLPIGSMSATVNGQTEALSQPAEVVGGSTMVPLRFVAEALGAYVQWVASSETVQIQTPEAHLSTLPPPQVSAGDNGHSKHRVVGQLTGIYTDTVPEQITVRLNGQNTTVPVTTNTVVTIRRNDDPGTPADLKALNVGDQVRVVLAPDGTADSIETVYGEIVGTVKNIAEQPDGSVTVNLNDGSSVQMTHDADATMAGRHIEFKDIMSSEHVKIRTDQTNKLGYSLEVETDERNGNVGEPTSQSSSADMSGPKFITVDAEVCKALPSDTSDSGSPVVTNESPAAGSVVNAARPMIYALLGCPLKDNIDQSTVRLLVDGSDVTKSATITSSFITYQPSTSLSPGTHSVALSVSDVGGSLTQRTWSFSCGEPNTALVFKSNRVGKNIVLRPGQQMDLILSGPAGGTAFATAGTLKVPLLEIKPGLYVGKIKPTYGAYVQDAPVTAHYCAPDHTNLTSDLAQMVTVESGSTSSPLIKSPVDGQQVKDAVQINGVSAPGAVVNVTIAYATKALGMFPMTGTAASTQVIADTTGNWTTQSIPLTKPSLLAGHETGLTITATSVNAAGQRSGASSVKVLLQ